MHRIHKLGNAKTETLYYQGNLKVAELAVPTSCTHIMADGRVTNAQRRAVLKVRTGTAYNQKHAVWFKHTEGPANCPLCGMPDSAGHMLLNCTHEQVSNMRTSRHHQAGRLILKALLDGERGAHVKFTDLGTAERAAAEGLDIEGATGGWKQLLHRLVPKKSLRSTIHSRPDALLYRSLAKPTFAKPARGMATIVEIKYCVDWHEQGLKTAWEAALNQHKNLVDALTASGRTAITVPIILGATGIAYKEETLNQLLHLGVSKARAASLVRELAGHAAESTRAILATHYHHRAMCVRGDPG
jgi:hypothetical protein